MKKRGTTCKPNSKGRCGSNTTGAITSIAEASGIRCEPRRTAKGASSRGVWSSSTVDDSSGQELTRRALLHVEASSGTRLIGALQRPRFIARDRGRAVHGRRVQFSGKFKAGASKARPGWLASVGRQSRARGPPRCSGARRFPHLVECGAPRVSRGTQSSPRLLWGRRAGGRQAGGTSRLA